MAPSRELFTRYLPTIIMVPAIVGIHFGWRTIQNNEVLVSKEEKRELPILILANKLTLGSNEENHSTDEVKS